MPRPPTPSRTERMLHNYVHSGEEEDGMMNLIPSLFSLPSSNSNGKVPPSLVHMFGPCRARAATCSGRIHRRNTSSSFRNVSPCEFSEDEVLDEGNTEDEENEPFGAAPSSSECHAHYSCRTVSARKLEAVAHGMASSPFPAGMELQRAAKSSSAVPWRHSRSQSVPNCRTYSLVCKR